MKQRQPTRIHPQPRALAALSAILAAAILLIVCLLFHSPSQAQDQAIPANVAGDVADILKTGNYQNEIPGAKSLEPETPAQPPPPATTRMEPPNSPDIPAIPGNAPSGRFMATLIIYALLAALAVLVLAAIFRAYRGSSRRVAPEVAQAISTPIAPQAPRPALLDQVEELAAAGNFEAAIHLMLLRALAALRARLGELPDSLTSREILRRSNLPREAAQPLSVIIGAVEISHFGGQSPNEAVYRLCIERYRQFLGIAA